VRRDPVAGTLVPRNRHPLPPRPQGGGEVDELARLASLHDAGALTDDELAAAKAKLLGI
jgi:Short C-terminal domain